MGNNLNKVENTLRSIAKRYKSVKYSLGLAILFLMMGVSAFSEEAVAQQEVMTNEQIAESKENLKDSLGSLQSKIDSAKKENEKGLTGLRLELIQLMEQGNQVVKSPWSSWQFGANYMYSKWNGAYKGRGDKAEKYPYEGILERDTNEFNRYVSTDSKFYSSLPTSTNGMSAATNSRSGLGGYGLASNTVKKEPIVSLELSAGITPRTVNKKSPDTSPAAPTVILPAFEPKLISPPVAPSEPVAPVLVPPTLAVNVGSDGNGGGNVIIGNGSNGRIQSVAVADGDFKIVRTGSASWTYTYSGYKGSNVFASGNASSEVPGLSAVPDGTWGGTTGISGSGSGSGLGFQSVIGNWGSSDPDAGFLSNANFLYTRAHENASDLLGEFVHQDVHGADTIATQRARFAKAITLATGTSLVSRGPAILAAYDDAMTFGSLPNSHTWINSGKIVIEGGNTSLGNTYTHGSASKQATINTGEVIFQPYRTTGGQEYKRYTGIFVISNDTNSQSENIGYNGTTGKLKSYTMGAVGFIIDPSGNRKVYVVNRGDFEFYGESSAGIYIKRHSDINLQTVTKNFAFNATTNKVTGGAFKPIKIFGDKSIGYYNVPSNGDSTTVGNFAVDIGAVGKGNQTFSTVTVSNTTAGKSITNLNINPTNGKNTNIEGSFGILSNIGINLTSHQIRIYDKTEKNV